MIQIVKPLRSGQITIPASIRDKLGIDSDTLLQLRLVEGELRLKPVKITTTARDTAWFKRLYDRFSPVRKEAKLKPVHEVDKAINEAIKAVRKRHA